MKNHSNANTDPLHLGDEVELYIGFEYVGNFRIIEVCQHVQSLSKPYYKAHLYRPENGTWEDGHQFSAGQGFSWFVINRAKSADTKWPDGCICSRCNARNQWAVPNKPDGKYICFECR